MRDMYLRCANELFSVRKFIFALRSGVRAKMIKEKQTTPVVVTSLEKSM
jgi:hypothetical protein